MRKRLAAAVGVASVVGALALRERWQRQQDQRHFAAGRDYWRRYLSADTLGWADDHVKTLRIPAGNIGIHLDVYARPETNAPVIVLAHGMLTYGKLYLPLVQAFFARGYTVISPDFPGNGFSGGTRGDNTAGETAAALVETTLWARQRYDGPLYLFGMGLGGPVAYAAAVAGAPVSAIACIDLFTFDDQAALRRVFTHPRLADLLPATRVLAKAFGWVRIPVQWVHRVDQIVAPTESASLAFWRVDPLVPRVISLRSLVSAANTPPAVGLEHNKVPTLVINQGKEHVLDPTVTRASYDRLGGPKRYVELASSDHWSFAPAFSATIADACDAWFRAYHAGTTPQEPAGRTRLAR